MNNIVIKGIYELDLDKNGAVALTAKNIELIKAIIKIDSSYRVAFDEKDERSAAYYIKNVFYKDHKFDLSEETIEEVVKRLDKENSTHLSVSGNKKGDNQGIKLTAKKISQIIDFEKKISSFDSSLVTEISEAVDGRNNFSFASKFCTYVSRFALEKDDYCIYDSVLADVIPYYAWAYCNETYINKNKNSNFEKKFKDKKEYGEYRKLIDKIIGQSSKITGHIVSRKDFDTLIWYCYKGDKQITKKLLEIIGEKNTLL